MVLASTTKVYLVIKTKLFKPTWAALALFLASLRIPSLRRNPRGRHPLSTRPLGHSKECKGSRWWARINRARWWLTYKVGYKIFKTKICHSSWRNSISPLTSRASQTSLVPVEESQPPPAQQVPPNSSKATRAWGLESKTLINVRAQPLAKGS